MRKGVAYPKKTVLLLLAAAMLFSLTACSLAADILRFPKSENEQQGAEIFRVLEEDTSAFFEQFEENDPQIMLVDYDQHYPVAIIRDPSLIKNMKAAMDEIRIRSSSHVSSTDGYHSVSFITKAGERFGIRFENSVLCVGENRYLLDHAQHFWALFKSTAKTSWEQAQENVAKHTNAPVTYLGTLAESISCEVVSLNTQKTDDSVWVDANAIVALTNLGDSPVQAVGLRIQVLDRDGYILDEQEVELDFSDDRIFPGDTKEYGITQQLYDVSKVSPSGGVLGVLVTVEHLS